MVLGMASNLTWRTNGLAVTPFVAGLTGERTGLAAVEEGCEPPDEDWGVLVGRFRSDLSDAVLAVADDADDPTDEDCRALMVVFAEREVV